MSTHVTLHSPGSDLTAVVGDNSAHGEHRAGYNGLWSLAHRAAPANLFVPSVAGMNLEHVLNGATTREPDVFFEPRKAAMELRVLGDRAAELHQPPTPLTAVESWTTFELIGADAIEFRFRAVPRAERFPHGYLNFFWASYIHAPEDKSMYFRGTVEGGDASGTDATLWRQFCTQVHARDSTVCKRGTPAELPASVRIEDGLMQSYSPLRWDVPLFYGRSGRMTFLVMFDLDERLRFSHSPSGGGVAPEAETTNPAWDFQYVLPAPRVGEESGFRARVVYRPDMTRADVLREYERFARVT